MTVANKERGEISLSLGGADYVLRPSFTAIQAMEAKTGRSLRVLVTEAQTLEMSLSDMGIVAAELIRAGGKDGSPAARVTAPDIAEFIFEEGLPKTAIRLTLALGGALTGGYTASGEPKPIVER